MKKEMEMIAKRKSIPRRLADLFDKFWGWEYRPLVLLVIVGIVVLSAIGIGLFVIYWATHPDIAPKWTGFGEFKSPTGEFQRAKTLWDWMDLLIVSAVLALGIFILNYSQRRSEQSIAEENRETDRKIALDRQHQTTLETYFDRMTALILDWELGTANESNSDDNGDEDENNSDKSNNQKKENVRDIARTRTLSVLRSLDAERVGDVFHFIDDAGLKEVISLAGGNLMEINWEGANMWSAHLSNAFLHDANLSGAFLYRADLSGAYLPNANLSGAYLDGADLSGADLDGADLSGADLDGADLTDAQVTPEQLSTAKSLQGATMPDGTKYEEWVKKQDELSK